MIHVLAILIGELPALQIPLIILKVHVPNLNVNLMLNAKNFLGFRQQLVLFQNITVYVQLVKLGLTMIKLNVPELFIQFHGKFTCGHSNSIKMLTCISCIPS